MRDGSRSGRPAPHDASISSARIWLFAAGYFLAYVPYALLTRGLADGRLPGVPHAIDGAALLPATTTVSAIGMLAFLAISGLWRRARSVGVGPLTVPMPGRATWLSGVCTAAIILTTTLAYTVEGAGIVTMMLLMRGGVLVLAPIVDWTFRRAVRPSSWVALVLSFVSVVIAIAPGSGSVALGASGALVVVSYLVAYFGRLGLMSRYAKHDATTGLSYFVEEQLVATPVALIALGALALGVPSLREVMTSGTSAVVASPALPWVVVVGLASQATGIFGALVLVDTREHTFSVPVNRAASVLAGVIASLLAAVLTGGAGPSRGELAGAGLLLAAIAALALGDAREHGKAPWSRERLRTRRACRSNTEISR